MSSKTKTWNFRVRPEFDALVREALDSAPDSTLTDFVVRAVGIEAERVLADRSTFVLSDDRWKEFQEALNRSPRVHPGIEKLLSKPSVFTAA